MIKVAVYGRKGGTGKSTLTSNIARAYSIMNKKTLVIDLDAQNDQSLNFGIKKEQYNKKVFDDIFIENNVDINDCIVEVEDKLYLMPNRDTNAIEEYLRRANTETVFESKLAQLEKMGFKYVFFDLPPSRSALNDAALYYIENLIMPVQLTITSVNSVVNTVKYLEALRLSPNKLIKAVIPNMYRKNVAECEQCLNTLINIYGDKVTDPVKYSTKISKVVNNGVTAFDADEQIKGDLLNVLRKVVPVVE